MLENGATADEIMAHKFFAFPKNKRTVNRNGAKTATENSFPDGEIMHISPIKPFGPNREENTNGDLDGTNTLDNQLEMTEVEKEELNSVMKIGLKSLQKFEKQVCSSKRSRSSN